MGRIFLITGVPGVGKSSVAKALLGRFEFGFYIGVDDLREWVVSGIAHPVPGWTDETERQFGLARRGAVKLARIYADAGFVVAIDDVVLLGEWAGLFEKALQGYAVHKVFLWADLEVNQKRNRERTSKGFDTARLVELIGGLHGWMVPEEYREAGRTVVNSTGLGVEATVEAVMREA